MPVFVHAFIMQPDSFCLCTAKDSIHPQCPQGYPQFPQAKLPEYRGSSPNYPRHPQLIHSTYPICFYMWIFMWTFTGAYSACLSQHELRIFMHVRVCSGEWFCVIRGLKRPDFTVPKTFGRNENEIPQRSSPRRMVQRKTTAKSSAPGMGTEQNHHLFLLLPRMVASGLAACFMKAEGLMPTMFLNCLEK